MAGIRILRPDLVINGFGSLAVGLVVTFVLRALSEDNQSEIYWCFIAWVVVGTPCCLISGISSLLVAIGAQDPFAKLSPHLRCDVNPEEEPFDFKPRSQLLPPRDLNV